MQSKCELIEYRVPRFTYSVDIKDKGNGSRKILFENTIKISTSNKDVSKGIIYIQTKASDETEEITYTIDLKGIFNFTEINIDDEEKEMILRKEGLKQLYSKLKEVLNNIQKITNQKLPSPPSLNEIDTVD